MKQTFVSGYLVGGIVAATLCTTIIHCSYNWGGISRAVTICGSLTPTCPGRRSFTPVVAVATRGTTIVGPRWRVVNEDVLWRQLRNADEFAFYGEDQMAQDGFVQS